jgi:hypothetical protein
MWEEQLCQLTQLLFSQSWPSNLIFSTSWISALNSVNESEEGQMVWMSLSAYWLYLLLSHATAFSLLGLGTFHCKIKINLLRTWVTKTVGFLSLLLTSRWRRCSYLICCITRYLISTESLNLFKLDLLLIKKDDVVTLRSYRARTIIFHRWSYFEKTDQNFSNLAWIR